jgi:hypothetical protein
MTDPNNKPKKQVLPVLATWFIHLIFWDFGQEFRQAIHLFHPRRARFILQ